MNIRLRTSLLLIVWIFLYSFLESISGFIASLLPLTSRSQLTESVHFFLFETPKVFLLLILVVFVIGVIRTYFSPERTRRILEKRSLFAGNILASMLGIVTPFCTCSAIPLFIGFVEAGIPIGVTFSFLIAAPMINEVAVVLLFGLFGYRTAMLYVGTGLAIAVTSGYIIGRLRVERFVEEWVYKTDSRTMTQEEKPAFETRIQAGFNAVRDIVGKIWIYILIGIAVGAGVHGYVPENFLSHIMGESAWWAVPVSVLIGVPLYSNAAGIIPVVQALMEKGVSLGTTLAFMMSVIGLSLPEIIILRKVLKMPLIFIFVGIVASGIILVGYIFNLL